MRISVIIITYNRAKLLNECLASLIKQTVMPDELIIVDGGSSDGTYQIVNNYRNKFVSLKYVVSETKGIAIQRNLGIKTATGDLIAFIDDDCIPVNDWIKLMCEYHEMHPECGAIGGNILNKNENSYIAHVTQIVSFSNKNDSEHYVFALATGNVSYKSNALNSIGLFDETLETCEDIELCYRLNQNNYKQLHVPEIAVWHDHYTTLKPFLKQQFNYGRGFYQSRSKWKGQMPGYIPDNFKNTLIFLSFLILKPIAKLKYVENYSDILLLPLFFLREWVYKSGVVYEMLLTKFQIKH